MIILNHSAYNRTALTNYRPTATSSSTKHRNMSTIYFLQTKWQFLIYNLTETWVAETLDNKFSKFYRRRLQIPVSGNISHLSLPRSKLGLEIKTLK